MNNSLRELLIEARRRLVIPPRLIKVQDGLPFEPFGSIECVTGFNDDTKPGDFAGNESLLNTTGNWNSPPATWRAVRMKWADNPAYAEALAYRDKLDAALAATPAPADPSVTFK
jgi:hypothetical protein